MQVESERQWLHVKQIFSIVQAGESLQGLIPYLFLPLDTLSCLLYCIITALLQSESCLYFGNLLASLHVNMLDVNLA